MTTSTNLSDTQDSTVGKITLTKAILLRLSKHRDRPCAVCGGHTYRFHKTRKLPGVRMYDTTTFGQCLDACTHVPYPEKGDGHRQFGRVHDLWFRLVGRHYPNVIFEQE